MRIWLPIADRKTKGEWIDFYTGSALENFSHPWAGSGGSSLNCARLVDENTWDPNLCEEPNYACMCTNKPKSNLEFKGLCLNSAIDIHYKPISDLRDPRKLSFQGLTGTSITYDGQKKIWTLLMAESNVTGMSKASHASFTLGKHNWTIKGDTGCSDDESYVTELKMSGCQKGNFTCNDGQCVNMDVRCNQLPDCRDESDERNCNILVLKDGYNKEVPPVNSSDPVDVSALGLVMIMCECANMRTCACQNLQVHVNHTKRVKKGSKMSKNRVKKGPECVKYWVQNGLIFICAICAYMHINAHVENRRMASPTLYLLIS